MSDKEHHYCPCVTWTGSRGKGTESYTSYGRDHVISVDGRPDIPGSSDPVFRGDRDRHNPEDLLVASLAACHMLWYLHLASEAGIVVMSYVDQPFGRMVVGGDGGGRFVNVILRPEIRIAAGCDARLAKTLHEAAHQRCFIANSVNFPVTCEAHVNVG
ncbi:MAG: OsmC family protein [Hyphomicrobiaceae bacterium]